MEVTLKLPTQMDCHPLRILYGIWTAKANQIPMAIVGSGQIRKVWCELSIVPSYLRNESSLFANHKQISLKTKTRGQYTPSLIRHT